MRRLIGFALCAAMPLAAATEEGWKFQHYAGGGVLPQAQVLSLHQDRRGFLWVGTYAGLARLSGDGVDVFSTADGLAANTIQAIASQDDGTVWAATTRGVCRIEPFEHTFECPSAADGPQPNVLTLKVEADTLWAGTAHGLQRLALPWEGQAVSPDRLRPAGPEREVAALVARDGGLLAGGSQGLWVWPREGRRAADAEWVDRGIAVRGLANDGGAVLVASARGLHVRTPEGGLEPLPGLSGELAQQSFGSVVRDADGRIWATLASGVLLGDERGFRLLGVDDGLGNEHNHAVLIDDTGTVWLGNDGGLDRVVSHAFDGYLSQDGLLQDFVRAIAEDARGRLWLGTRGGAQVVRVDADGALHELHRITADNGLTDPRIYGIGFDGDTALLATGDGLVLWQGGRGIVRVLGTNEGLPDNAVRAVHVQAPGRYWVGTRGGSALMVDGLAQGPPSAPLDQAFALRIREDARGRLWFATLDQGVLRLDPDGSVHAYGRARGLSDEIIWDVDLDADGGVWVGTNGDGLFRIAPDDSVERWTTADGLVDNFIWQVLVDDGGQVWGYTNRGLARFDGDTFYSYGAEDGLLHLEGSATAVVQQADGRRWFASASGLMTYLDAARHEGGQPLQAWILQALVDGYPERPGLVMAPERSSIEFVFAAPTFRRAADLRYRYRLLGAAEAWSPVVRQRPVTYANLGPGHYTFEVQVRDPDGQWREPAAAFEFRVLPPWWATVWFWATVVGVAVLLVAAAFVWRSRQARRQQRALEAVVAERTAALEDANRRLEHASLTDPLTGLYNRRFLARQMPADTAQARRAHARGDGSDPHPDILVLLLDIDHFKQINDEHGHAAGDRVLQQYAGLIREVIRESDYAIRAGGEEFLIVARQANRVDCRALAERLVERVRTTAFAIDDAGGVVRSTCSIGASHIPFLPLRPDALGWEQVVEVCDSAVYLAKALGRDGWVVIGPGQERDPGDASAFVRALKLDPLGFAEAQGLHVDASRREGPLTRPR